MNIRRKINVDFVRLIVVLFTVILVLFPPLLSAWSDEEDEEKDFQKKLHAQLKEWRQWKCEKEGHRISTPGITFQKDVAQWHLVKGNIKLRKPFGTEGLTAFVFSGTGLCTISIPWEIERRQLKRFIDKSVSEKWEFTFDKLVLQSADTSLLKTLSLKPAPPYKRQNFARKITNQWLRDCLVDTPARLLLALFNDEDSYVCVDMHTKAYGWLRFEYDPLRYEEISIKKKTAQHNFVETWLSLDRVDDRNKDGSSSAAASPPYALESLRVTADITRRSKNVHRRLKKYQPFTGAFTAHERVSINRNGLNGLWFYLHPRAKVVEVKGKNGKPLPFIRNHVGKEFTGISPTVYDTSLTIIVPQRLLNGHEFELTIDYELDVLDYVAGNTWIPLPFTVFNEPFLCEFTVTVPQHYSVKAVGTLMAHQSVNNGEIFSFTSGPKVRSYGFSFGKSFKEKKVVAKNELEVVGFGDPVSLFSDPHIVETVAKDVAQCLDFYQDYYHVSLPITTLNVSRITARHSQSFPGLILLTEAAFASERPGVSSFLRAHEAAHQIFGNYLAINSYRDEWLSESLAEFSAFLYLRHHEASRKFYAEALSVYRNQIIGSLKQALSPFARPWNIKIPEYRKQRLGAISLGYRASASLIPQGFRIQCYQKAPLMLRMLEMIMVQQQKNAHAFRDAMRDFVNTFKGRRATSADFIAIMQKHCALELHPFFQYWLDGTMIPQLRWKSRIDSQEGNAGRHRVTIEVACKDTSEVVYAPLPLTITTAKGEENRIMLLWGHKVRQQFNVSERIISLQLDPENEVPAILIED